MRACLVFFLCDRWQVKANKSKTEQSRLGLAKAVIEGDARELKQEVGILPCTPFLYTVTRAQLRGRLLCPLAPDF